MGGVRGERACYPSRGGEARAERKRSGICRAHTKNSVGADLPPSCSSRRIRGSVQERRGSKAGERFREKARGRQGSRDLWKGPFGLENTLIARKGPSARVERKHEGSLRSPRHIFSDGFAGSGEGMSVKEEREDTNKEMGKGGETKSRLIFGCSGSIGENESRGRKLPGTGRRGAEPGRDEEI